MKSEPWDICEVFSIPPTVLGILWLSFLLGPNGLIHIHLAVETRVTALAAWTNLHSESSILCALRWTATWQLLRFLGDESPWITEERWHALMDIECSHMSLDLLPVPFLTQRFHYQVHCSLFRFWAPAIMRHAQKKHIFCKDNLGSHTYYSIHVQLSEYVLIFMRINIGFHFFLQKGEPNV